MTRVGLLASTMLVVAASTAAAQGLAPPAPEAPAATSAAPNAQGFTYRADGRRDPFVSLFPRGTEPAPGAATRLLGLAGMTADEISLRGVLVSRNQYLGIVYGSDNKTYVVRAGQRLLDGTIRAIDKDSMVIVQWLSDPRALAKQRELRKGIRQDEAK